MTKFIDCSQEPHQVKETVFTHVLDAVKGWSITNTNPNKCSIVRYLGKCKQDGDMFACYDYGIIGIYKGIKGSEFNYVLTYKK